MKTENAMVNSPYRCLNRDVIKYIAMFTMLLNHIATIFLETGTPLCEIFLAVGYFTAPVMVYFLVEGYGYTHSKNRYFLRLLLFAAISEIPYCIAFSENDMITFCGFNMLCTLCLCFGIIWMTEHVGSRPKRIGLTVVLVLSSIRCDWALLAPIMTLWFIQAKKSGQKTEAAFAKSIILFAAVHFLGGIGKFSFAVNVLYAVLAAAGVGLAGICIVFFYNGRRMKAGRNFSKWFFYLFYPVHLLILGIIRLAI